MLRDLKNAIVFIEPNDQDTISLPDMTGKWIFLVLRTTIKSVKICLENPLNQLWTTQRFMNRQAILFFTLNYHELKSRDWAQYFQQL